MATRQRWAAIEAKAKREGWLKPVLADAAYLERQRRERAEEASECPGCHRIMSARERAEQGICNDCGSQEQP